MTLKTKFSFGDILHDTKRNLIGVVVGIGAHLVNDNTAYIVEYRIEANGKFMNVNETPQVELLKEAKMLPKNIMKVSK